jgi:hypothetical protein
MAEVWQIEADAEYEATREAFVRLAERRARRRQVLRWWNPLVQVVADPASAVPVPGVLGSPIPPAPGTGSGAAGSQTDTTSATPARVTGPGNRLPGAPTSCRCAGCISGQRTSP